MLTRINSLIEIVFDDGGATAATELLRSLIEIVFDDGATATELLRLVVALGVLWAVFFTLFSAVVKPLVHGKPWLIAAGKREYERGGKELYESLGMPKTQEQFVETFMDMWPWNQAVFVQHFIGGMLCLPSILGIGDEATASSLACLGILSEMGWEIEDMITWIYKRFALPDGKAKVPTALLIVLAIHHSMTTILGLPMVLRYRHLKTLHWLCFDLQLAGAVGLAVTEYTKLLDIKHPRQLHQFKGLTLLAVVVMIVTRGLHWPYLCAKLAYVWYEDRAWVFLGVGSVIIALFSLFNWVFCIEPFCKRFMKFAKVSAEYEKLPADADDKKRRSSIMALEHAAADVLGHGELEEISELFVVRKVERRGTVPASMFGSKPDKRKSIRQRASMVMLSSSSLSNISRLLSELD